MKKEEEKADQLAYSAHRQVKDATTKLKRSETLQLIQLLPPLQPLQLGVQFLPPTVRLAWPEEGDRRLEDVEEERAVVQVDDVQTDRSSSKQQAIKTARYSCIFGIFPALVMIGNVYLNNYQPHGTTASILITYGIIVPLVIVVSNKKIRQFAKKIVKKHLCLL